MSEERWEREVIEKVLLETLREQQRQRRWNLIFRTLFFLLFIAVFLLSLLKRSPLLPVEDHAAQIRIEGVITSNAPLNADRFIQALERIEKSDHVKGLLLRLNSPGGSPVQADRIYRAIRRFKEKKGVPVVAVVEEICASGCYYIAAAADEIYVNPTSLVGSIGVLFSGFGFVELIEKLGIERRLYVAGEHKGMLDAFSPIQPEHRAHLEKILQETHQVFIEAVKADRGERLKPEHHDTIFSGLIFSAKQGVQLGLVDGFGAPKEVIEKVMGTEKVVDYTPREEIWQQLARSLGVVVQTLFQNRLLLW